MKTKICSKCKREKSITEFHKHKTGKNKGYYFSYCKKCRKKYSRKYNKKYRKENPWYKTYIHIFNRCNNSTSDSYNRYKDVEINITLGELKELWIRDNADSMKRPSIDRIDSKKGYTKENCRYIELVENSKRRRRKWSWSKKAKRQRIEE